MNLTHGFDPVGCHTAANWQEADAILKAMAERLQAGRVVHGTGYPVRTPHLLAVTMDALSGEGMGYNLTWYPEGDVYDSPKYFGSIRLR